MIRSYDAWGNLLEIAAVGTPLPLIIRHPVSRSTTPGGLSSFSVLVADTLDVNFQWRLDGSNIPGATGDSLLLTNVSEADEGQYSVVVTNSAGSVTSAPAALMLDTDGDGLPDTWEKANFTDPDQGHPLNPTNQRAETDPDKDGISNFDEFLDGTDPNDTTSLRPRLTAFSTVGGSVTASPMKLSYALGESVTLTPLAFPPNVFIGWSGDLSGAANPVSVTMDRNKTIQAKFAYAVPLPSGLIALWRGETDASDVIGGHDGAFFTGATAVAPRIAAAGKVGGAFDFDGTAHIRVPDAAALRPAHLTIEGWVFPVAPSGGFHAIIARGSSTNEDDTWYLGLSDGLPQFWSHRDNLLQGPTVLPENEWTHLAATFDGSSKRLYVNGAWVASHDEPTALVYDAASLPVSIGSDWAFNVSSARFNGRIDELALYGRALTEYEIRGIFNADLGKDISRPYFTSLVQFPDAANGAPYTFQLRTVLGAAPVNFSLLAGMLPAGLTLSSTGVVSGVPNATGTSALTVLATDTAGMSTEQRCALLVV